MATRFIPARDASEKSFVAAMQTVNKSIEELVPVINKAIERSCSNAEYHAEVDLTKYNHLTMIADKLDKELRALGYKTKLVDDDNRGYYLYITWN